MVNNSESPQSEPPQSEPPQSELPQRDLHSIWPYSYQLLPLSMYHNINHCQEQQSTDLCPYIQLVRHSLYLKC